LTAYDINQILIINTILIVTNFLTINGIINC